MEEALSGLKDIHLPPPVGWWPPAPGWWLLAGLLLVLLFLAWRAWSRRKRARALRDEALAELAAIREAYAAHGDPRRLARDVSRLLRRVAISRFPREQVAGLVGEAWLAFLDRHLPGEDFAKGPGRILAEAPYRPATEAFDAGALFDLVQRWIETVTREQGGA